MRILNCSNRNEISRRFKIHIYTYCVCVNVCVYVCMCFWTRAEDIDNQQETDGTRQRRAS